MLLNFEANKLRFGEFVVGSIFYWFGSHTSVRGGFEAHLITYNSKSIRFRSKTIIPVERRELVYLILSLIFKFLQNELAVTHQISVSVFG